MIGATTTRPNSRGFSLSSRNSFQTNTRRRVTCQARSLAKRTDASSNAAVA